MYIKIYDQKAPAFKFICIDDKDVEIKVNETFAVLKVGDTEHVLKGDVQILSKEGNVYHTWDYNDYVRYQAQLLETKGPETEYYPVAPGDQSLGPDSYYLPFEGGRWLLSNGSRGTFIVDAILCNGTPMLVEEYLPNSEFKSIDSLKALGNTVTLEGVKDLNVVDFYLIPQSQIGFDYTSGVSKVVGSYQFGEVNTEVVIGPELKANPLYLPLIYAYSYFDPSIRKDVIGIMDFNRVPHERTFAIIEKDDSEAQPS